MRTSITLPNLITLGRLVLVPVVLVAITEGRLDVAFWLFLVAGISDGVDGFIARHWNWRSELGAHLDPLADKALLVGTYAALGLEDRMPRWLAIIVISRDLAILGGVLLAWVMHRRIRIAPLFVSKMTTAAQIALALMVLARGAFHWLPDHAIWLASLVTAGLTCISGAAYLWTWLGLMSHDIDPADGNGPRGV